MNAIVMGISILLFLFFTRHLPRVAGGGEHILLEDIEDMTHDGTEENHGFSNEWIVKIDGEASDANALAYSQGYDNIGPIDGFDGYYLMRKSSHPMLLKNRSVELSRRLESHGRVRYAAQLFHKKRVKRGIDMDVLRIWDEERRKNGQKLPSPKKFMFNDELWDHQWYLQDTRSQSSLPSIHLNVLPVYDRGITGKGVRVVVLDDGLEWRHSDIMENYDPSISYDFNNGTHGDSDPTPRYPTSSYGPPNSHGTRCSGEISMVANNGKCGVGVAYHSKIGGIRMLDGTVNDRIEGLALKYACENVDIYTASWGPTDDGKTVEGPGVLAQAALKQGVLKGRKGKGSIYVWAAGNGGVHSDNCNCDGYTSSIYTISIGSASQRGEFPWYGESCSSTLASTFSSGAYTDQKIATTDTNNTCTVSHTGTSAAAPLAAGLIALALEANPKLSWRDVQHLIVISSTSRGLLSNAGWKVNGAGHRFNSRFGFGVMDANAMVEYAQHWKMVPSGISKTYPRRPGDVKLEFGSPLSVSFIVGHERPQRVRSGDGDIRYLEHVQVIASIQYTLRGSLEILLKSPQGTYSQLLTRREKDESDAGFNEWSFMSVHFWGEDPEGQWEMSIVDRTSEGAFGQLLNARLVLHGMEVQLEYMKSPLAL